MRIRDEAIGDIPVLRRLIGAAMLTLPQTAGTEAAIVDRLRAKGALTLSLAAEAAGAPVGHLAASAARVGGRRAGA